MRNLVRTALHVAPTEATILLVGETGVGKGHLARLIHEWSNRGDRPFIHLVCGALSETLVESELFGHERGAFTGAETSRPGRFELAGSGTIFLDEVADLTAKVQIKILRILEERCYERVGGSKTLEMSARVLVATNRELKPLIRAGKFREDLYHRLNVIRLDLPPLRSRRDDIPWLIETFAAEFGRRHRGCTPAVTPEAVGALCRYDWPGNVRDLRNCIERAVVLDRNGIIDLEDLPGEILNARVSACSNKGSYPVRTGRDDLIHALTEAGGNKSVAAHRLGLCRSQFYRLLKANDL